jgi:hypothetical protein
MTARVLDGFEFQQPCDEIQRPKPTPAPWCSFFDFVPIPPRIDSATKFSLLVINTPRAQSGDFR